MFLTPEKLEEAMQVTGLGICFSVYYDESTGKACALGHYFLAKNPDLLLHIKEKNNKEDVLDGSAINAELYTLAIRELGDSEATAFTLGFDGLDIPYSKDNPLYEYWYNGKLLREKFF